MPAASLLILSRPITSESGNLTLSIAPRCSAKALDTQLHHMRNMLDRVNTSASFRSVIRASSPRLDLVCIHDLSLLSFTALLYREKNCD